MAMSVRPTFSVFGEGENNLVLPSSLPASSQNEFDVLHAQVNKPLSLILQCFICSAKDWVQHSAGVEKYINLICCETSWMINYLFTTFKVSIIPFLNTIWY